MVEDWFSTEYVFIFQVLKDLNYKSMTLQIGRGIYEPQPLDEEDFKLHVYRLKPSIKQDIEAADLIISHAGK